MYRALSILWSPNFACPLIAPALRVRLPSRGGTVFPSRASPVAASGGRKFFRAPQRLHSIPDCGGSLTEWHPLKFNLFPMQRQCHFRRTSRCFKICPSGILRLAPSCGRNFFCVLQSLHGVPYSGGSLTEWRPLASKFCHKQKQCNFR